MARQAQVGGEQGKNGEWYEGGQFLPSSSATVKGAIKVAPAFRRGNKQEIAPYQWQPTPQDGYRSIYKQIAGSAAIYDRTNGTMSLNERYNGGVDGETKAHFTRLIDGFNNGYRWVAENGDLV